MVPMPRRFAFLLLAFAAFSIALAGCIAQQAPGVPGGGNGTAPPQANKTQGNGTQIANPASVFCVQKGYRLEIRKDSAGAETGYCIFGNGRECEEWAFFRGECGENNSIIAGEDETCGGIANIQCADGLACHLGGNWPDAGGKCVRQSSALGFADCPARRSDECTAVYSPVCGRSGSAPSTYGYKDYPNDCVACSRTSPAGAYARGTCAQNNLTTDTKKTGQLYTCPSQRPSSCAGVHDPVCGRVVDATSSASFYRDFDNPCAACSATSNAIAYYLGRCAEVKS